jgi:glycine/D-amino acid oxidase-like deaminating enzyme
MSTPPLLPVAVIGAGPVGLAAAAELIGRGVPVIILEAGDSIGAHVRQWGHVRMFSPWRYNISRAARVLLAPLGWREPDPDTVPTGRDLFEAYLAPLAEVPAIRAALQLDARVTAVTRLGLDKVRTANRDQRPFVLRIASTSGERDILARGVIDCSGTYGQANPGGAHGIAARGEHRHREAMAYGMPDVLGEARALYAGRRIAVLGSGHSAIGVLLDLVKLRDAAPGTEVLWLSRRDDLRLAFGGGANDALPARGALGTGLRAAVESGTIEAIHPFALDAIEAAPDGGLMLHGEKRGAAAALAADRLVVATGFRPDLAMLGEIRLDLDPALEAPRPLAPLIDPNIHSCGTVRPHGARELGQPEAGFYLAGIKSYGRAPTFLLATGYEQVRSIVAEIAGDHAAAARVELDLPETGVCSTDLGATDLAAKAEPAGCCGGPPKVDAEACCVKDEAAKSAGEAGCGCSSKPGAPLPEPIPAPVAAPGRSAATCCR